MTRRRIRILTVQLVIALVALEALLRIYNPIPFRLKGDKIVLPVNQIYKFENVGATKLDRFVVHRKNSLGFRGPEPPRDFDSKLTVVAIGGSTTECLFLSDGKTWTDALGRMLAEESQGVWINNAGLDGHSTYGHIVLLEEYVAKLKPKIALFLVGANDVELGSSNTFDNSMLAQPLTALATIESLVFDYSAVGSFAQNLYRAAAAKRRGFGHSEVDPARLERLVLDASVMDSTLRQHQNTYLSGYAERLKRIVTLSRTNHIEPVLITQPALFGETRDRATGVELATVKVNGRGNGALEWKLLELYNDTTRRIATEQRVLLIDLAQEMPKDSRLFYDFLHFTNQGAQEVAKILFQRLVPQLQQHYFPPTRAARS